MRTLKKTRIFLIGVLLFGVTSVFAVQVRQVNQTGRQIQLDGFLLDWQIANAQKLGKDSTWQWDVINTREGVTGYFKTAKPPPCSLWQFSFFPHQLSPYNKITTNSAADNKAGIGRTIKDSSSNIVIEWIIPWDSITHDSAGMYQIGVFASDVCGDSLPPVILSGHMYKVETSVWSGVYGKAVLLGVLLVLLFCMQKFTRGKFGKKRKSR